MSEPIGTSGFSKYGPFDLEYTDWGFILVYYKGILLGQGRPWIKKPSEFGYSELIQKIYEEKNDPPRCAKPACGKERSELSNYCPDHKMK